MAPPSLPPPDPHYHVAQVNVARVLAPLDSPALRGFVEGLEPINALADRSPGFVWRLQTEAGDATAIRPYDDDRVMVNLSVWGSLPALWDFVYLSRHLDLMRRRREWFERIEPYLALLTGLVRGLGARDLTTRLDPAPGRCCVVISKSNID